MIIRWYNYEKTAQSGVRAMNSHIRAIWALIIVVFIAGCGGAGTPLTPVDQPPDNPSGSSDPQDEEPDPVVPYLGQLLEFDSSCCGDTMITPAHEGYHWEPDITEPYEQDIESLYITSENGKQIWVTVHKPVWASEETPCHGIVTVPGGFQEGNAWDKPWHPARASRFAKSGFVIAYFDVQGRGKSEGIEDFNGLVHRGDLKSVIEYVAGRPDVLPIGVGVLSSSMGMMIAAPVLAENPDIPVRFLIDQEGPADRWDITHGGDPIYIEMFYNHGLLDNNFWSKREPVRFAGDMCCPYIRVQSDFDHYHNYFYTSHAIALVNEAVRGGCPYVRLNRMEPNVIYNPFKPEKYDWLDSSKLYYCMYDWAVTASMDFFLPVDTVL